MLDIDPLRDGAPTKPAATVVLVRDTDEGMQVFLVQRARGSAFMGGAYVFPGGKLDPGDTDAALLARCTGTDRERAREALCEQDASDPSEALGLHVAALRETFEEAGVLFADAASSLDVAALRAELAAGAAFGELVERHQLALRVDRLVPFARWVTPAVEKRRFDARFFVAQVDASESASHDERETIAAIWRTPREAIAMHHEGRIDLPPPTLRTLEELAPLARAADVIALASSRRPPFVRPVFRDLAGTWVLSLPGDPEHPEPGPILVGPTRFTLRDGRFVSG